MAGLADLRLRAWPHAANDAQQSLSTLISRLNAQEGSFRDINEEELLGLVGQGDASQHENEADTSEEDEQEPKTQREKVLAAREEIAKFANQALTESSHTLDFISLLLTNYNLKQASFTISPFIKQTLPNGCFGTELVEPIKVPEATKRQNELVSFGWKLQSMTAAADSILRAASNLDQEMDKEAKYWEQVLSVKRRGWPLFRVPQGRGALAVRYGSLESPPEFRDKGVAALRRGEDGAIEPDFGNAAASRTLRVRVKAGGEFVASARTATQTDRSLETTLLHARNDLFDEELYNEMHREARSLTNRGVKYVSDGISIPLKEGVALLVDLVDSDSPSVDTTQPSPDSVLASYPEQAATAFRILLSYSHRQHYRRRTDQPPPLKYRKKAPPLPSIIQPIVLRLEHQSALMEVRSHLALIETTLQNAGIAFKVGQVECSLDLMQFTDSTQKVDHSHMIDELMSSLCYPPESSIATDVGFNSTSIKTSIRTRPNGTEFLITYATDATDSALTETPHEMHFYDVLGLQEHLCHLVMLELIGVICKKYSKWEASAPDEGQLMTEATMAGDVEMLMIKLDPGLLEIAWSASDEMEGEARRMQWTIKDTSDERTQSFLEQVELLSTIR